MKSQFLVNPENRDREDVIKTTCLYAYRWDALIGTVSLVLQLHHRRDKDSRRDGSHLEAEGEGYSVRNRHHHIG